MTAPAPSLTADEWGTVDLSQYRGSARDHALVDYRLAVHAQVLREERYCMGYREERAAFYGSEGVAAYEHAERKLTYRDWLVGMAEPEPDHNDLDLIPDAADDLDGMHRALEVTVCLACAQPIGQYDRKHGRGGWITEQGWNLCPAAADDYHRPSALAC